MYVCRMPGTASHTQSKPDDDDDDDLDDLDDINVDSPVDGATRLSDERPESRSSPEPSPGLSFSSATSSPGTPPPIVATTTTPMITPTSTSSISFHH